MKKKIGDVTAAYNTSKTAAKRNNIISPVKKIKMGKKNEVSIASKLKIKHIPDVGYDFDDVIENVEKLMDHFFNTSMDEIKSTIDKLATKYSNKIDYNFFNFFHLADNTKAFDQWHIMHKRISKGKVDPAFHLMDMYFQMRMVENFDFYNDVLIYNYTEDIQPFLK